MSPAQADLPQAAGQSRSPLMMDKSPQPIQGMVHGKEQRPHLPSQENQTKFQPDAGQRGVKGRTRNTEACSGAQLCPQCPAHLPHDTIHARFLKSCLSADAGAQSYLWPSISPEPRSGTCHCLLSVSICMSHGHCRCCLLTMGHLIFTFPLPSIFFSSVNPPSCPKTWELLLTPPCSSTLTPTHQEITTVLLLEYHLSPSFLPPHQHLLPGPLHEPSQFPLSLLQPTLQAAAAAIISKCR